MSYLKVKNIDKSKNSTTILCLKSIKKIKKINDNKYKIVWADRTTYVNKEEYEKVKNGIFERCLNEN